MSTVSLNVSTTLGAIGTVADCNGLDLNRALAFDQDVGSAVDILVSGTNDSTVAVPLLVTGRDGLPTPLRVKGPGAVQIECSARYMWTRRAEGISAVTATIQAEPAAEAAPPVAPSVSLPGGVTIAGLGSTVTEPFNLGANSITITAGTNVAGSDTDYWSFNVGYYRGGSYTSLGTADTKVTGGYNGMTAGTPETLTHSAASLEVGDILAATATKTSSPAAAAFVVAYPPV